MVYIFLFPNEIFGQLLEDYQPLQPSGEIPKDITTSSTQKFQAAKKSIDKASRSRKAEEDFLLESNFLIDQVLTSGRVLFNDAVSAYLNEVLDEVLKDNADLRSQIRIYAVRSSIVNSFFLMFQRTPRCFSCCAGSIIYPFILR